MKQAIINFILIIGISFNTFSQGKLEKSSGIFYKISLSATATINEDYTLRTDDDEHFFRPNAFFINNTLGYQFDEQTSIAANFQYDWHSDQGLNFFPAYMSFKYNLIDDDDTLFLRGGYGKLLNMGKKFETGSVYKLGAGVQIFDDNFRNSWLVGLDFTRKRFGYKQLEKISSVSLFIEFQVF